MTKETAMMNKSAKVKEKMDSLEKLEEPKKTYQEPEKTWVYNYQGHCMTLSSSQTL